MGLSEFFQGRRAKKVDKTIKRMTEKLTNLYRQTAERKHAIQVLAEIGTPAAISGLLKRFTVRTPGPIVDEDEKQLAFDALKDLGPVAIEPSVMALNSDASVYWPLKIIREIAGDERALDVLIDAIDAITDDYEKDIERKTELVSNLREFKSKKAYHRLMDLLDDDNEEIRVLAVDGLTVFPTKEAIEKIVGKLLEDDETVRLKNMILDLLVEHKWPIKKFKKDLTDTIPDQFFIDDTGVVQRK